MEIRNKLLIAISGLVVGTAIGYFSWGHVVANPEPIPKTIVEEVPMSLQKQQVVVEYIWPELEIDSSNLTKTYTSFNGDFKLSYPDYFSYDLAAVDCEGCSEFAAETCPEQQKYKNMLFVDLSSRPLNGQLINKYDEVSGNSVFYMAYSLENNQWESRPQGSEWESRPQGSESIFPRVDQYAYYFPKTFITENGYTAHMYGGGDINGQYRQIVLVEHPDRKSYVHIILSSGTYTCGGLLGDTVGLKVANPLKFLKSSSGE